ncbi:tetratricopeptide repeat protein [Planctomicrobium sp. SH664]|uniref:tetratricopeptide repeat protein n=1 Tax=Planctomicrobium sp. SH664 TaxID=3448125 RepID=UPI003F5BB04B
MINPFLHHRIISPLIRGVLIVTLLVAPVLAEEKPNEGSMATAVALNYCRASFHRIRKYPTETVLREEQEKILNNLNLGRVNDPEVIALYSSVLDEISQIGLVDKERSMYQKNHTANIRRQVTWDAVAFGTDLLTAQFGSAVKTGANSWWDYRSKTFQRDTDLFKIEKNRVASVVQRSNQFLDTFWKLARKKNIPDRWLVRGDDLDQLEKAMQENDPAVRLRVLRRMENYMEAYPPYWYHVARTQQELGELSEAAEQYQRLEKIGNGHFRKDELLSTAMANMAAIEDYLGRKTAVDSARKSLAYSTDVWEANLMSARILQRHGQIPDAEDAILRNIDVGLEKSQSHVFLASLYYFSHENEKLVSLLNNAEAVAHLPAPVLLRCAALVGVDRVPPVVVNNIVASLEAYPRSSLSSDQLMLRVGSSWQLHLAKLDVYQDGVRLPQPHVTNGQGYYDLRYTASDSRGLRLNGQTAREVQMELTYPDDTIVTLTLKPGGAGLSEGRTALSLASNSALRISSIKVGDQLLGVQARAPKAEDKPQRTTTSKPVVTENPYVFPEFEPRGKTTAIAAPEPSY